MFQLAARSSARICTRYCSEQQQTLLNKAYGTERFERIAQNRRLQKQRLESGNLLWNRSRTYPNIPQQSEFLERERGKSKKQNLNQLERAFGLQSIGGTLSWNLQELNG